jgi:hypothetical protein
MSSTHYLWVITQLAVILSIVFRVLISLRSGLAGKKLLWEFAFIIVIPIYLEAVDDRYVVRDWK